MAAKLNNHYHGETPNACPKCGSVRRKCYHTETMTDTTVVRYCKCKGCGYQYTTTQSV